MGRQQMIVFTMRECPNNRPTLHLLGKQRKMFADGDPGNRSGDGLEFPPNLSRRIRFGVKHVQLARTPTEMHVQHGLGLTAGLRVPTGKRGTRIGWQH